MSGRRAVGARLWVLPVLVSLGALLAGCTTLPESGPVHRQGAEQADAEPDAPYFNPPGPAEDGSPAAIVSGFLVAMQANPLSTSVARTFLSENAGAAWKPNGATIVYEAFTVLPSSTGARVQLSDTRRLDSRGGWLGDQPGRSQTLDLRLVSEDGQWRIDNPPNALVVPTSYFDRSFARFDLFFYDQTGRTLLPDPVFIPRGEQSATNLVRGLLAGPGEALSDVATTAFPPGTGLDLSVVVTAGGIAEVPLTREVLRASPAELSRCVDQLAWTLRQVPGIERVRITVDGAPAPLTGGRIDAPVTSGPEFDAAGTGEAFLWGVRSGRVVDLLSGAAVGGALGRPGYALRSLAVSEVDQRIAAVARNGRAVFVSETQGGGAESPARRVVSGTDLLRPSYDMFGDLWLLDRTDRGARMLVVRGGQVREVVVPGVTGEDVTAFQVARDGSRLAVAYAGNRAASVRVTTILRTDEGLVTGAGRSLRLFPGSDAVRLVDIGWRSPDTLAVLSRPTAETSRVTYLSSDGSPTSPALSEETVFRDASVAMVVSPDQALPLRLVTPGQRLYTESGGSWPRTSTRVVAAAYAR